ncbi:hypothetical protein ACFRAO_38930 [Streptomyces sp. NPDC056656]|uniref:hypothetical protein n=1 Tax=Streptomyces sp. NPDC056656 TaxID=3345895 RepID=UPI003683693E
MVQQVAPEAAEEGVGVALGPAGDALGERVVLTEPAWAKKLSDEDRRGLTALFWSNVNPYGTFRLDMDKRLDLGLTGSRSRTLRAPPTVRSRRHDEGLAALTAPRMNEAVWRAYDLMRAGRPHGVGAPLPAPSWTASGAVLLSYVSWWCRTSV